MTTKTTKQSLTESLHARIPQGKLKDIDHVAENMGRSRNWVLNEALNQYLDMQEWQIDLIKKRVKEAEQKDAVFVSHEDIMKCHEKRLRKS